MFSLIITIISIALVAALALATLFYGGSAYNSAQTRAAAVQIDNQAQQLLGATQLFRANTGTWPQSTQQLLDEQYLKSLPVAQRAVAAAVAQSANTWRMVSPGVPAYVVQTPEVEVCRDLNERRDGQRGITETIDPGMPVQCFGSAERGLTTLAALSFDLVQTASANPNAEPAIQNTVQAARPTVATDSAWVVKPTDPVLRALPGSTSGGTGGSTGGNTGGSGSGSGTDSGSGSGSTPPPAPQGTVSPTSVSMSAAFGSSASSAPIVLTNSGTVVLTPSLPQLSVNGPFSMTSDCAAPLQPNESCSATVTFTPTAEGVAVTTLSFGAFGQSEITATGLPAPVITELRSPSGTDFGQVTVGTNATRSFEFQNRGLQSIFGIAASVSGNGLSIVGGTCGSPSTLAPNEICTVTVRYQPSAEEQLTGTLNILSSTSGAGKSVALSGSSVMPPPETVLRTPQGTDFGQVAIGGFAERNFQFENTGIAPVSGLTATVTGEGLTLTNNTCGTAGAPHANLSAGGTCDVTVRYSPTSETSLSSASLTISSTTAGAAKSVSLTGSGYTQSLQVTGNLSSLPANVVIGRSNTTANLILSGVLTIRNTSAGTLPLSYTYSGINNGEIQVSGCPTTLTANQSCTASVSFSFEDLGAVSGTVGIQLGSSPATQLSYSTTVSLDSTLAGFRHETFDKSTGLKATIVKGGLSTSDGHNSTQSAYGSASANTCPSVRMVVPTGINNGQLSFRYRTIASQTVTISRTQSGTVSFGSNFVGGGSTTSVTVAAGETVDVAVSCGSGSGTGFLDSFLLTWQ